MATKDVRDAGDRRTVVWKGHPACGSGFSVTARFVSDGAASGPGIIARNRKMFMDSMEIVRKAMKLR